MRNLFLTFALVAATAVSAQELSTNIQETYHSALGLADEFHVWKVTNVDPTEEAWDKMEGEYSIMEFEPVVSYGEHALHTWEEAGVYVVFCTINQEPMGERTFFIINESYVDFVKKNIDGIQVQDTYVRSDVEWVGNDFDKLVVVR